MTQIDTASAEQKDLAHLREMIKDIDFCMLTTLDEQGNPHSRPMSTNGQIEPNGDLWFFTYGSSHKVHEVEGRSKVNCNFADPSSQRWVSVTGTASIVRDKNKIRELWQPQLKAWFPKGVDEPDIALLKVHVEQAEYWDNPSSTLSHAVSLASSLITGKPANPGENKKLDLTANRLKSRDGSAYDMYEQAGGNRQPNNRRSSSATSSHQYARNYDSTLINDSSDDYTVDDYADLSTASSRYVSTSSASSRGKQAKRYADRLRRQASSGDEGGGFSGIAALVIGAGLGALLWRKVEHR